MDDSYVTRMEHEEFCKRLEAEDKRQNKRLDSLEETVRQINALTISVSKMADSLERMVKVQENQGDRLERLENVPAKNWNTVKAAVLSAIGTAVGTGIIAAVIHFISI